MYVERFAGRLRHYIALTGRACSGTYPLGVGAKGADQGRWGEQPRGPGAASWAQPRVLQHEVWRKRAELHKDRREAERDLFFFYVICENIHRGMILTKQSLNIKEKNTFQI